MANREDLTDAILELCNSPHMLEYALSNVLQRLELLQLADAFDHIADHHSLLTDHIRPRVGMAAETDERWMHGYATGLATRAMRDQTSSE